MIVELRNVSRRNKGAELMLRTMLERLAARPGVRVVANMRVGDRRELRDLGIGAMTYLHASDRRFVIPPRWLVPAALRRVVGAVHPAEVDLVLDAAGFAYGDSWGPDRARNAADYYRWVRRHGGRVVLMPQSFGPFEDPAVAEATRRMIEAADRVYPRDATAMAYVRGLVGDAGHVRQAPDFTPLLTPPDTGDVDLGARPAAIIPNGKMVARTSASEEDYVRFMAGAGDALLRAGLDPFLLPHAVYDRRFSEPINARLSRRVPVVDEPDAARLKGLIGRCEVIACSRFHGLVSALCQGVPVIATGWSHKYRHLLDEYGCPDALLAVDDPDAAARAEARLEPGRLADERGRLRERAAWHRGEAERVWADVEALLDERARVAAR